MNYYLRFLVVATFCLIIAGGLVTSTDSGLSVPDWPKSYGMWMPPMVGGVFYEHGHRMIASFVGLLTVILAVAMGFKEKRRWVRRLSYIALAAVILQGILGGITVLFFLPAPVSVTHATFAQSFFTLIVCLSFFTSRSWNGDRIAVRGRPQRVFLATAAAVYLQLILGAVVRHTGSELAIPDFPLAFGRIIPSFDTYHIGIHFAHRVGAVVVLVLAGISLVTVLRKLKEDSGFVKNAVLLFFLVCIQIALGGYTVLTKTAVPVTTAHVACGALILASSVVLAIRGYRFLDSGYAVPIKKAAVPA